MDDIGRWVAECWNCGGSGWLGAYYDEDERDCPQCDGAGKIEVVRAIDYLGAVGAGDALAGAVSDIMADDPDSVLHTWVRHWQLARSHRGGPAPMTDKPAAEVGVSAVDGHPFMPRDLACPWGLCQCGLAEASHTTAAVSYMPTPPVGQNGHRDQ